MKGASGLHNVGNTCYLNATLQCLRHCTDISKYILTNDYKKHFKDNVLEQNVIITWHELLYKLWSSEEPCNPIDFVRCFIEASKNSEYSTFVSFQQNDVDEFLTNIINIMHNAIRFPINFSLSGEPQNDNDHHAIQAYNRWKSFFEKDYSIFVKHLYSQYITKTECPECGDVSFSYDPVLVIHAPIPDKDDITLYDCLDLLTDEQELDEENKWKCDSCKVESCATLSTKFWDTSKYFIVLLKRYSNDRKNDARVDIPDRLNLKKYAVNYRKGKFNYQLSGICHHSGSLGGGHYYATCKTNGQWTVYNDSTVTLIDQPDISNAYCLFYRLIE